MSKAAKNNPIKDNIYFFDKKTGEKKVVFDRVMRNSIYMLRADNPNKSLSEKACRLLTNYYDMISNSPNGTIFVDHEFISGKTRVGNRQNNNLHKELLDIFNIKYHQSIIIEGRKYRDGFTIEFTQNTEVILEDPKLFYSSQMAENCDLGGKKFPPSTKKISTPLYIEEENLKENLNRSIKTEEKIPTTANEETRSNFEKNISEKDEKVRTLKDYHPLSKDDCYRLQQISKRMFALNAMNEILLDMSRDIPAVFYSKKGFIKYFSTCLQNEKRDPNKINNETFKIKANLTDEDKENQRIYNYLKKVEESLDVSPELHFKKKLACVLADKKAYNLLTSYKALVIKDQKAKLYLRKIVELTPSEHNVILNQIKASHPASYVEKLELISEKPETKMQHNNLDAVILQKFGSVKGQDIIKNCSIKKLPTGKVEVQNKFSESLEEGDKDLLKTCIKQVYGENIAILAAKEKFYSSDENELWKQFKDFMKKQFRSDKDAESVIATWFAKLKHSQNIGSNKLIFTGIPFIISYIESNYSGLIDSAVKELKINIEFIYENNSRKPILYESGIGQFKRMDEETMNRLMSQPIFHTEGK
ncbi:hypothetical protein UFOVP51_31 [uncultured Caudovirales phage]|uniref:Uncharacterized protein n=1 Tax=uncultured Caudovirales phage TaxID=2100421 RepID=A0A6J5T8U4_9CAUD|nr:hypothetical protein UFOVP51_31 [uncultured Caudovirales phage]CAB4241091.1 hypothetical protein UFOVP34_75 [uncultured Caudovirales phage]